MTRVPDTIGSGVGPTCALNLRSTYLPHYRRGSPYLPDLTTGGLPRPPHDSTPIPPLPIVPSPGPEARDRPKVLQRPGTDTGGTESSTCQGSCRGRETLSRDL